MVGSNLVGSPCCRKVCHLELSHEQTDRHTTENITLRKLRMRAVKMFNKGMIAYKETDPRCSTSHAICYFSVSSTDLEKWGQKFVQEESVDIPPTLKRVLMPVVDLHGEGQGGHTTFPVCEKIKEMMARYKFYMILGPGLPTPRCVMQCCHSVSVVPI